PPGTRYRGGDRARRLQHRAQRAILVHPRSAGPADPPHPRRRQADLTHTSPHGAYQRQEANSMMGGSTLLVVAMIAMMVLMMGGMLLGAGRALLHRRKRGPRAD